MNISFSQVREDPEVEISIVKNLAVNTENLEKDDFKILQIVSGGCTLLSLLSVGTDLIHTIDAIDVNQDQIYLCQLKFAVVKSLKHSDCILNFYEGVYHESYYVEILNYLLKHKLINNLCFEYWSRNISHMVYGINKIGKYENLFRQLADTNFDFDTVFDHNNLVELFGHDAVKYTTKTTFPKHFKKVFEMYKLNGEPKDNYFYQQFISDEYFSTKSLPVYLSDDEHILNICKSNTKINYHNQNMCDYLNSVPDKYYNFINLSNITDWMSIIKIQNLLLNVYRCLKQNGVFIIRRLASDADIEKISSEYFEIQDKKSYPEDKSYFYQDIIVGRKK